MRRHSDCIRLWLSLLVISCSFILSGSICAQEPGIIVQGKVYDQNDQPVVGASVLIQGTRTGAVTGDDGTFEIRVPDVNTVLEVSFLGYVTQTRTVGMQDWIDFFLEEDRKTLDAVVVVAYGTQTKATVTGALSTMEAEKLTNTTVADFTNILAGQLPGVSTIQTTGQPGADNAKIFVRGAGSLNDGASSPLILGERSHTCNYQEGGNRQAEDIHKLLGRRAASDVLRGAGRELRVCPFLEHETAE